MQEPSGAAAAADRYDPRVSVEIIRGTNDKPISSQMLIEALQDAPDLDGQLTIGFPILGSSGTRAAVDAVYLSRETGLVLFDLLESAELGNLVQRQDDAVRLVQSRLLQHRDLVERRQLRVPVNATTFGPLTADQEIADGVYLAAGPQGVANILRNLDVDALNEDYYLKTLSALQNISNLRRGRNPRLVRNAESRGHKLAELESSISTLDRLQSKAVIETIQGVQRIRGLAGSGKTIVLALKAAYLHAQHPEWKIAVTFNTRSLKDQFTRLITAFSIEQTGEEPDLQQIRIVNAWGGRGSPERSGIYYEFCRDNMVPFFDYKSAEGKWGRDGAFAGVCQSALEEAQQIVPAYDAILIDEAQDFPPSFLRLCYEYLRGDSKRLVYAYDELQTLHGEALPPPEGIFGADKSGEPRVTLAEQYADFGARRDIVLDKCYRNSRPVLVTAHALGFGIYHQPSRTNPAGLVQMFDRAQLWTEIGYRVFDGTLKDGASVTLGRTHESSPPFLEKHSTTNDLIHFARFDSLAAQNEWIADQIAINLRDDELRYDDIVVINPLAKTARSNLAPLRRLLLDRGINSHLAGVDTSQDVFFNYGADSITFTGVYRAKGNEAGMVYVANANECDFDGPNLAAARNALFTAITRSKAWVRVAGVGDRMDRILAEATAIKLNDFKLSFNYPTPGERETMNVLHRDVSTVQREGIEQANADIERVIRGLQEQELMVQDLDPEQLDLLTELLKRRAERA